MTYYRKTAEYVAVYQFTDPFQLDDAPNWVKQHPIEVHYSPSASRPMVHIFPGGKPLKAYLKDYLVFEQISGKLYVCRPDDFAKSYETVG